MNCRVKNGGDREEEDGDESGRRSVERISSQNGSTVVAPMDFSIDERVLIDAESLFIGSNIGQGAHGKVCEGRYDDRIVAIKVLNCGNTLEDRAVLENRFVREVTIMSKIKHENLLKNHVYNFLTKQIKFSSINYNFSKKKISVQIQSFI